MARELKPQQIEMYKHRDIEVPIMLNRNTVKFFAEYGTEKFENPAIEPVRSWLKEAIERSLNFIWSPTIEVAGVGRNFNGELVLGVKRYYTAVRHDGKPTTTMWDIPIFGKNERHSLTVEERNRSAQTFWWDEKRAGKFALPCFQTSNSAVSTTTYYLPYTDELWEALNGIITAINYLRDTIAKIMDSDNRDEMLTRVGQELLAIVMETNREPQEEV